MQLTLPAWYRSVNRFLGNIDPHDAPIRTPMTQVVLVGPYRRAAAAARLWRPHVTALILLLTAQE